MLPDISCKSYLARPEQTLALVCDCPLCERHGLWRNGTYARWIPDGMDGQVGKIFRKYCPGCKTSFSLIPDFIVPRRSYGRPVISRWLYWALNGEPVRSRQFLAEFGVAPDIEPGSSWTDTLLHTRTSPGYQLLATWLRDFTGWARTALPMLLLACTALGCDLSRKLAEPLSSWKKVPERAIPLALALGVFAALAEREDALSECLDDLVLFLAGCGPHKARRVRARHAPYSPDTG